MSTYTQKRVRSHRDIPRGCRCEWELQENHTVWVLEAVDDACPVHGQPRGPETVEEIVQRLEAERLTGTPRRLTA